MRYLRPDPVEPELIRQVVEAATWAPSPGNSQGRDVVVVTDPEAKAMAKEHRQMADATLDAWDAVR